MNLFRNPLLLLLVLVMGCRGKGTQPAYEYTNALVNESSPYLLQHAHNPVNWEAWSPEVLARAQKEDKPLLISIGYASCHWCHVMEDECFEDMEVAQMMNDNFINIKIDREERPDVDQIYMDALQLMTQRGGWPLNIIALPDGKPYWGTTYSPKKDWLKALEQSLKLFKEERSRVEEYAANLSKGITAVNLIEKNQTETLFGLDELKMAVQEWSQYFDLENGGYTGAPKFMMPNNLDFLLHYATATSDTELMKYVDTTLTRMARGGVFDPVGGGFSRYSVDEKWHVPHFEKMLYDNGQLVSLYAKAYAVTKNPVYKKVVEKTIAFVVEELQDENGGFYSSLDADSLNGAGELEEGAFYVWQSSELEELLGDDFSIFKEYFNINSYGLWEENKYVLIQTETAKAIAEKHGITTQALEAKIEKALAVLKSQRSQRSKPRLDHKILTSWNGLMLNGLVDASRYLENEEFLKIALENAVFLEQEMIKKDFSLYRTHSNGESSINGFLEDYALLIEAFINLYEVTFDEKWLTQAKKLLTHTKAHFWDDTSNMFFYTSDQDESLIRRSMETQDNVISASNSVMAKNLIRLRKLFPDEGYGAMARQMVENVQNDFPESAQGYANWLHCVLYQNLDFYEVAIVGDNYRAIAQSLQKKYLPNTIMVASPKEGELELLQGRYNEGQTLVYICIEGACKLPVQTTEDALVQMESKKPVQ
ncbi:MAG: thioredoxin domain-containing protein [Bacteroidota bacterium]